MESRDIDCPIWGTPATRILPLSDKDKFPVMRSPRTGGDYKITPEGYNEVLCLDATDKAKLTTILIDLRRAGDHAPWVTPDLVKRAKNEEPLPVYVRAERLLRYLVDRPHQVGDFLDFYGIENDLEAFAQTESVISSELTFFVNYLRNRGWLEDSHSPGDFVIAVEGYAHIAKQAAQRDSSQCFVAMWFDDSMNSAYEEGIKKAVEECGYTPLRIDKKPDVNKIDDEIIAEIRRSRFVVADFTHDKKTGVRGGVYYEAGFAYGLGLEVIYSCRKGLEKELNFDTRQYHHILWETQEDLRKQLKDRIRARVGDGPKHGATNSADS